MNQLLLGVRVSGLVLSSVVLLTFVQANLRADTPFALLLLAAAAIGFWCGACWADGTVPAVRRPQHDREDEFYG